MKKTFPQLEITVTFVRDFKWFYVLQITIPQVSSGLKKNVLMCDIRLLIKYAGILRQSYKGTCINSVIKFFKFFLFQVIKIS